MTLSFPLRSRRDLRLASGTVLFSYLTLHLACHALGLVSLDVAEAALHATVVFWHSWLGTLLLSAAAIVHVTLALLAVYERRTLRMPAAQALRIVLGLTMPIVLIGHFVSTRYAFDRFGLPADYQRVVGNLLQQGYQGRQLALLVPGWLHGCLGLHYAFGRRRSWQRLRFGLFGAALLLPVLAALGFLNMGRELGRQDETALRERQSATAAQARTIADVRDDALSTWYGIIALIVVARLVRSANEQRRRAVVRIAYPGRTAVVPRGWTVLEASRSFDIPHESLCGGRARCTTCRVRVVAGLAHCPAPGIDEQRALDRIRADPTIRLACQLRPTGDISVQPLLAVTRPWWRAEPPKRPTLDRELAVLLCSFRLQDGAETADAAHDAIYAIDRFHRTVGASIAAGGGVLCGQRGDTWTALFGIDGRSPSLSCSQALDAARTIEADALELVARLARELGMVAEFSLALHVGRVVVGTLGAGEQRTLSAIGPAVRAAESLDAEAKRQRWRFVVSQAAAHAAAIAATSIEWQCTPEDGRDSAVPFAVFASARQLPVVALEPQPTLPPP